MSTADIKSETTSDVRFVLLIIFIVAVIWAVSGFVLWDLFSWKNGALLGEAYGVTNALFSGLAFGGVIYAIILQRRDLQLQRQELALSREELKRQRDALDAQNQTLQKQNFESTFFQLLGLQGEIVNGMDLRKRSTSEVITQGRDCFRRFFDVLTGAYRDLKVDGSDEGKRIAAAYLKFFDSHQADIGHYFRSLYNIIKFVDKSDVSNKRFYVNLVRAQLSSFELLVLFYNCLSSLGRERFKPLVEKYGLLENFPQERLLSQDHMNFYAASAFTGAASGGT